MLALCFAALILLFRLLALFALLVCILRVFSVSSAICLSACAFACPFTHVFVVHLPACLYRTTTWRTSKKIREFEGSLETAKQTDRKRSTSGQKQDNKKQNKSNYRHSY